MKITNPKLIATVVVSTLLLLHGCKASDEWQLIDNVGDKLTLNHSACTIPEVAAIKQMDKKLGGDWFGGSYVTPSGGTGVLCWTMFDAKSHLVFIVDDEGDMGTMDIGTAV